MNYRTVARLLGVLVLIIGMSMVLTLFWTAGEDGKTARAVLISMAVCLTVGVGLVVSGRGYNREQLFRKEGLGVVALGWMVAAILGGLPYVLAGVLGPIDAFFESMSGFTTTGSSVISNIEGVPRSILFWRDFTHWLGGIGIIVLFIAILPQMGVGARHLFRSEIPGAVKEGVSPRIKDTAIRLLAVYMIMTVLETVLLLSGGMNLHEALCHTFGTVATGGFSTKNLSVAGFRPEALAAAGQANPYSSRYIEGVIIVFMVLAGTNFSLYFLLLRRRYRQFMRDPEWRAYLGMMLVATIAITLTLTLVPFGGDGSESGSSPSDGDGATFAPGHALRAALFQVVSIATTTGYTTENFDLWPSVAKLILLVLMFVGGSSGSTGGGMKVMRIMVLVKHSYFAVYHWFRPHGVVSMRFGGVRLKDETVQAILGYFVLFIGLFVICSLIMAALGLDLLTATTSVAATMGNIGPGLAGVGALENFANVHPAGKILLSMCMLLGRLELFTVMVLFVPAFWRR